MMGECGSFLGKVGDCLEAEGERALVGGGGGLDVHLAEKPLSLEVSLLNKLISSSDEFALMSDLTGGTILAGEALTESCKHI